jgi:hypothetical protein
MWPSLLLLFAQIDEPTAPVEPPLVGRPPHFYGAIGAPISVPNGEVRVELTAEPTTVNEGGELTLTITVRRVTNPTAVQRIDLTLLQEFTDDFQIDPGPTTVNMAEQSVSFQYTLRPRRIDVQTIPAPPFKYFRPGHVVPHKGYMGARVNSVPIVVLPRTPPPAAVVPLVGPEWAFRLAEVAEPAAPVPMGVLLSAILGPILLASVWQLARRRPGRGPSRAGRRALAALRTQEPSVVVRRYLVERFAVPAEATTPMEIAARVPNYAQERTRSFWQTVDAARFGPVPIPVQSAAVELIAELERSEGQDALGG